MNSLREPLLLLSTVLCAAIAGLPAAAQTSVSASAPRQVPAKSLPVPTDVSPEMQKVIGAPLNRDWDHLWFIGAEWRAAAGKQAAKTMLTLPAMRERLHVTVKPDTIAGVRVSTNISEASPGLSSASPVFRDSPRL